MSNKIIQSQQLWKKSPKCKKVNFIVQIYAYICIYIYAPFMRTVQQNMPNKIGAHGDSLAVASQLLPLPNFDPWNSFT